MEWYINEPALWYGRYKGVNLIHRPCNYAVFLVGPTYKDKRTYTIFNAECPKCKKIAPEEMVKMVTIYNRFSELFSR